jgi:hypothetical protein
MRINWWLSQAHENSKFIARYLEFAHWNVMTSNRSTMCSFQSASGQTAFKSPSYIGDQLSQAV